MCMLCLSRCHIATRAVYLYPILVAVLLFVLNKTLLLLLNAVKLMSLDPSGIFACHIRL